MNILFSTDKNYFMPMVVSIVSILENNKDSNLNIYILSNFLEEDQKEVLVVLEKKYNQKICLIIIESEYFDEAPTLRWTKEAYYRLLVGEKLPASVNRIIYLDCDTIVNGELKSFYYSDLGVYLMGALCEGNNINQRVSLGLSPIGDYYQSGVILMDLNKCRDKLKYNDIITVLKRIKDSMIAVDQDIINVIFDGKIKKIDKIFNNCEITNYYGNNLNRLLNRINKNIFNETVIFHYATGKPWNNLYPGSCENLWYKYLKLSPYSGLYYKKFNKIKFKILRLGIFKVLFFEYIHLTPYINKFFVKILPISIYKKMKLFYRNNIK